ncbi:MAG: cadherin-like beta sandwich domain-containing protein [Oscillospiraceae bacterium]|nr:cadherin-like beta sandwich domain-containing protein [Oscillospiraceae bacterium]
MKRRLLAFLLAFVMTFSLVPVNTFAAEADAAAHYTNITTESGENVTVEYVETVVGEAAWGQSINTPYYHVTIPEGTEKVLLTYPESVNLVLSEDDGAVFFYRNTYPGQSEINLGGALTVATNDDGSKTVTIPVERFMRSADGSVAVGMAYYVDEENQSAAEFFDFTYAALTHAVTLTSGEGYTLTGETTVEDGKDYSFTVTIADDYEMEDNFVVKANGETLTAGESGSYTVENVTADLTITVEGVVKKQAAGHAVTLTPGEGYTLTGEATAEDGKDYTFTVTVSEGYDAANMVVKVNGEEVTAVDGIYTVEKVSSDLTITVEGVTEAVQKTAGLSVLKFGDTSTESKAQMFQLIPAFDPAVKEYTVLVPDNSNMFYAWATQAIDRSSSTTITAKWVNLNVDTEKTQALTSGKASGQNLAGFAPTGTKVNTMTVTVVDGDFKDEYKLTSVRVAPSLTALSLDGIRFAERFSATKTAYTATTAAESVTVAATPRDESYTVTVNGGSDTTVPLNLGENKINVVVTNPGGYTNTYTITVTRLASIEVGFTVDPADAKVTVWDSNKDRIAPTDGKYSVMADAEYTYLVQSDGYVSQKSTFKFSESSTIDITLAVATENPNLDRSITAEWGNFRNGDNNLGITNAKTPYAPEDTELLWAVKHGTGWAAAPGSPIMVDGDIYTYSGSTIRRLNSMTGETVTEGTMVDKSSYSIVPMTYGDGMVFVGLSGGKIQAFNAKTLESLWVYTDELGGQPNCPITYKDGYIYAGFWNSEDRNANFACINTVDEDHASATEVKYASWTYTRAGGFYWAGAYVTDKLAIVGTDDGAGGYDTNGAALLVFDRFTGEKLDAHEGIRGDLRSNVSHDPQSDRVFFTTKGGILGNAQIDWDTGKILDYKEVVIKDAQGNANAMSTCTPSVYNGRIYIGVAGTSQFGANSGHGIAVYNLNGDGSMTQAYVYAIVGYPQTSAMVSTAYSAEDGSVYIYLPYNYTPGGVSVLKDKPGQTAPVTTTGSGYSEVFTPVGPLAQYCICSTIADQYGTIYYKNDSCYMMAITSKIESLEITQYPTITENEDGSITVDGLKAVTKLKNGEERDVSNYVSVVKNEETGGYTVSYTYGFDNANYGLKTVTAEISDHTVTIPENAGYTVTGEKTVKNGEDYTFTVTVTEGYDGTNMVVKVNDTEVTAVDGKYTVEKVSSDLTITVEGVVKAAVNGLSALRFGSTGTNSSAKKFELSPAFDPAVKEYTLLVPDTTNAVYVWATRGADLTTKAKITAAWTSMSTGKASTTTITSGSSSGKNLSGFNIASAESNTVTITVTEGDVTDVYTVKTVRIDPSLTKLSLDGVKINETFVSTKKAYTAITTKDSVTVLATPRGEDYTITYNGETSNVIPLTMGENKIEIAITNKDGYTNSYTLTVTKAEHAVTIPTGESFLVTGKEAVADGADYTFTVEIDYRYELDDDFAVKVNGETVTGEKGVYTVKNVTTDLVITVEGLKWKVLEPVTVYFSFSHDEKYQFCDQSGKTVALQEVTVPYFDLGLYGLEDFYFASENYGPASGDPTGGPGSKLDPGTKEFAYGKITMLHLFLYATEVYYLGIDPADAGKGYMADQIGSDTLTFSGSAGSIYMTQIWGYDENLNYYLNYEYPLASEGWGSTSDQILLHDGDVVTLGHFTDWSFYSDTGAVFNHIETDITDPVQGDKVTMTIYRDGADFGGSYKTAHTVRTNSPSVYCTLADSVTTGDVTKWKYVGTADADGTLVVDTSSLAPGEYIFAIPGQYGNENPDAIVGAPGGIRLTIHEKPVVKGDLNGDGVIDSTDVMALFNAINSGDDLDATVADVNGDGVIDARDVMALYNIIKGND